MLAVRRYLVLQTLMLWQGGFVFYAAVVVPAGEEVLGSSAAQGVITARVTDTMNAIGVATLVVLALDLRLTTDPEERRKTIRWWCWSLAVLAQGLLMYFHVLLDAFMDSDRRRVVIGPPFGPVHNLYLWTTMVQWADCLLLAWMTLRGWRAEDRLANAA